MPGYSKSVIAWQFTEESKNRVFNNITCNKLWEFDNNNPVIKIQTPLGLQTCRFGDWILLSSDGEFYVSSNEALDDISTLICMQR